MTTPDPFAPGYRLTDGNQLNNRIANPQWSTSVAVSATPGGTALNSVKVTNAITNVAYASVSGAGLVLPQAIPGTVLVVVNNSAYDIRVFADGGSTVNGLPGVIGILQPTLITSFYVAVATNVWQQAINTNNFGSFTQGSVIFAGAGSLAQDNANFYWDDTNNRLGIGTSGPSFQLDVQSNSSTIGSVIRAYNANSSSTSYAGLIAGNAHGETGAFYAYQGGLWLGSTSNNPLIFLGNNTEAFRLNPTGEIQFTNAVGTAAFPNKIQFYSLGGVIYGVGVATGELLYNAGDGHHAFYTGGSTPVKAAQIASTGLTLYGTSSGGVSINPAAAAGTYNFNLPTTAGSAGYVLTSQGGGSNAMTWTQLLNNTSPITTITTGTTLTSANGTVLCNAAGGAITVTLPTASGNTGLILPIKKIDATANAVTISSASLIDGQTAQMIFIQYQSLTVQSDGTTWWVI